MRKTKTRLFLIAIIMMLSSSTFGQNVRGFYLQDVGDWLGDASDENDILEYAQGNGFNYILFYDLGDINWGSSTEKNQLAAFMHKARTQYGISEIGGVVEYAGYVTQNILPYNNSRASSTEKFDVINLEFEFWVKSVISSSYCSKFLTAAGYSCDTAGAWKFAWKELKLIDDICATNGMTSEFYLGWPNKGQLQQIASRADRILLSAYRPTDSDIYVYSKSRMQDIASIGGTTKIITLLSSESSFMGPWLSTHPQHRPYNTIKDDLDSETSSFKNNIDLQGYQWFTYKYMPKTISATASISASGSLNFCPGGSVTLTANSGSAYVWLPGGQTTRSITVTNPGSYSVTVTNNSGISVASAPAVVSNSGSGAIPAVTASGPLSFCPGGSVTLTSSSASSYLWTSGQTTKSITVSSSGTYSVTTGGGSCSGTSAPVVVNSSAAPPTPTITASGSLNVCQGNVLTLTSSSANGYLWSNGETTRSIVVASSGNYSVNTYSGPNCYSTSAVKSVTQFPAATKPVVASKTSTTITSSHPAVVLSSSPAHSYQWSNGATTKAVKVSSQGSYFVTITDANGCKAISDAVAVSANGCTPPPPPVITSSGSNIINSGESITLTSSTASGYLWSNGETTKSITVSTSGTYTVRAYNGGGCFSTSLPTTVTVVFMRTAGADVSSLTSDKINFEKAIAYPNPANVELNILFNSLSNQEIMVKLIDLTGREVQSRLVKTVSGENQLTMDVSLIPKGIYFACLINQDQKKTLKFVVD